MTLTFLAAGEPTIDAVLGRTGTIDIGLTKQGRRQVKIASTYVKQPEWLITSHEPDTRESARILLGSDFARKTHFLPELRIDFPRPNDRPVALWKFLQNEPFRRPGKHIVILVRSGLINQTVRQFFTSYSNASKICRLMDRTSFDYGGAVKIDCGPRHRVTLFN
jgi:hypothetical protein